MQNPRPAVRVVEGVPASDGAGVRLTRLIGTPRLRMLDPFLMLDFFGSDEPAEYLAGFPDHPHRGFETVTYMLAGRIRHADNKGNAGVIGPGGVQWMTAGRGLVHSEMPEQEAGLMKGFQLWVNLPARLKLTAPAYQEFPAEAFPVESREGDVVVKVVAGSTSRGTTGPVRATAVEARYFDVTLPPGARFEETLPGDHNAFLAVFDGSVAIGPEQVRAVSVAALGEGDGIDVTSGDRGARFLLVAGQPIGEPVAWAGPFVMNTREEVLEAYRDFEAGRF
jgi:redox-sensitive bicupin YhaK (pirin superfamily)